MTPTEIVSIFYQCLLLVIGVPGNLLIILTYAKRQHRNSAGVFIMALALADLGVCLMSPVVIYSYVVYYNYPSDEFCQFRYYTTHGLFFVSQFLTTAVAIERYLAICKPLSKRLSPKWAIVVVTSCAFAGFLISIPVIFTLKISDLPDNSTICDRDLSDPGIRFFLNICFPVTFLGGLVVVIVCYGLIYRTIRRHMKIRAELLNGPVQSRASILTTKSTNNTVSANRKTSQTAFVEGSDSNETSQSGPFVEQSSAQNIVEESNVGVQGDSNTIQNGEIERSNGGNHAAETSSKTKKTSFKSRFINTFTRNKNKDKAKTNSMDKTTKMLLVVTVIYFVSFIPQFVTLAIPKEVFSAFEKNHKVGYEVFVFFRRMITINHIVNPFVYGLVNKRFRKDCVAALKGLKDKLCGC